MQKRSFTDCFNNSPLILTEGAIGLRLEHEYNIYTPSSLTSCWGPRIKPDKDVVYAGLIYDKNARRTLTKLYGQYLAIARDFSLPIMLMTNTRRANRERVERSPFGKNIMRDYTEFLYELAAGYDCEAYVGGMTGCRGDAYSGCEGLAEHEAYEFHMWQAEAFKDCKPDFMYAAIMPCLPEAAGMAKALETLELPYIISFMINRDGNLLDGTSINDAILAIDGATALKPLCYMTNCVHPDVLAQALSKPANRTALVRERFCGIQANAANADACTLDKCGEPVTTGAKELAECFAALHNKFPMKIYGGCCGTDNTHIYEIALKMKRIIFE
jgi:S-methylmethionine-dependent homocysteine/selenocysteine methylase